MTSCVLAHAGLNFHKAGMQILLRVKIGHQRDEAPLLLFLIIKKNKQEKATGSSHAPGPGLSYSPGSLAGEFV